MIDVNVTLGRWPFRRLPCDETEKLVDRLQANGITQAWAGSFDGVFHKDVTAANARLASDCHRHDGLLVPFGSINPMLPDWQDDLRRCHEEHGMPGVRLHPNYHRYELDDPAVAELLGLAEERRLVVQIAIKLEDERTQHPLMQVPAVDPSALLKLLPKYPRLRVVLLNSLRDLRGETLSQLAAVGNVFFDISMLEGVGGIERLIKLVPFERVLLGSHFPFFYLEAALLKLEESELGEFIRAAIVEQNARGL